MNRSREVAKARAQDAIDAARALCDANGIMRFLSKLLCIVLIASCASPAAEGRPHASRPMADTSLPLIPRVAGCYFLESGTWETTAALDRFIRRSNIPRHFEFEMAPLPGFDDLQNDTFPILRVRTNTERREPYFEYWQPSNDKVNGFHTGIMLPMHGANMELQVNATGLSGTLVTFSDAVDPNSPPPPPVEVRLRPEQCKWVTSGGAS